MATPSSLARLPHRPRFRLTTPCAALCLAAASAWAAPVTISTPFINLENRAINSLGFASGQFMRIGAVSVTPNGNAGTVGLGTHLLPNGNVATRAISFIPSPLNPNFFQSQFADNPNLRGNWTLRFNNGADSASVNVNLSAAAQQVAFVNSITLSGTSANPTFAWTPPPGVAVDAYRVNIYDKSLVSATNSGQVTNRDLAPGVTSYTVNASDFRVAGNGFALGKNYSIEISIIQTKDGTSNSNNSNIQAISRVYADFTPNSGGGPPVNLPVVLANGSFQFNMSVVAGQTYYIDPEVAVGYDYEIGAGDPNFATLDLPETIGDGLFDIFAFDGNGNATLLANNWDGRNVFNFGAAGVSKFRVLGIETAANLDPNNTTAFITGLSFAGSGQFTGTQTPITVTVNVPEPATLALVGLALAGLGLTRRQRL